MSQAGGNSRLEQCFVDLSVAGRGGLVTFITAGDPDPDSSFELLRQLPAAGADLIELGMPFSDPMADGPAIQSASQRALRAAACMVRTLDMVARFRADDKDTPIILMGYYNPIHRYGPARFVNDAMQVGVDGVIIVDLPPEEDEELCHPALTAGLHWIRLVTPTTDDARLPLVLNNTSGFVYYVSIAGITGTRSAAASTVDKAIKRLRRHTDLPLAVGFGINTPEQVAEITGIADAAVVGSALVTEIAANLDTKGKAMPRLADKVCALVSRLAEGTR
ncbi:MAG: tryptophan synthase subunit alpha [Arenicellales bacterium]|nr:tryptophan synthase subunit alpha [Arenicellales bacterium]